MELQLESWSYISWALWTFFLNGPITFWEEWILFCLLIWSETIGKRIQLKNRKKSRLRCNKVEKCKVYTLIIQTYKPKTSKHGRQTFPPKCSTNTLKILSNKSSVVILDISHNSQPTEQEIWQPSVYIQKLIFALLPCYYPTLVQATILYHLDWWYSPTVPPASLPTSSQIFVPLYSC